jgi:hypothetical protein
MLSLPCAAANHGHLRDDRGVFMLVTRDLLRASALIDNAVERRALAHTCAWQRQTVLSQGSITLTLARTVLRPTAKFELGTESG